MSGAASLVPFKGAGFDFLFCLAAGPGGWAGRKMGDETGCPITPSLRVGPLTPFSLRPASPSRRSIPQVTVQPSISTIPCKYLYSLANPVLPFPMVALSLEGFSSPPSTPKISSRRFVSCLSIYHPPLATAPLTPFAAALTAPRQLNENSTTLSPLAATLTSHVNHNPFVCHSYKKHPGVGVITSKMKRTSSLCRHTTCTQFPVAVFPNWRHAKTNVGGR
jgi:hypothetical protein